MISALSWMPRGAARPVPQMVEPSEEELAALRARAAAAGLDDDEAVEEEGEEEEEAEEESEGEPAAAAAAAGAAAASRRRAPSRPDPGLESALAELHMEKYDEEDEAGAARLFGGGGPLVVHASNDEDPYITLDEEEDEEEVDDFTLRDTDLLLLAARTEDEVSHLEVWVYEEAGEDGEANLYVHHDQLLPAFPLALAWLDCPPGAQGAVATGSLCAVGTMESAIEVWDLDLLDAVEPALTLGTNTPASQQTKPGRKAKPKASPAKGKAAGGGGGGGSGEGHSDAVLGLSWNATFRNVLASASADSLVKVWDVACGRCEHTLAHHGGKVQACAWSPASASLLLTGSFDRTAAVADVRTPGGGVLRFALSADCEALCWAPGASGGHLFAVTAEDGTLSGHDARAAQAPLFRVAAHGKAACGVAACPAAPGLLATCGMDKTTALWDVRTAEPALLQRKDLRVGAAFGVAFAQSAPHLLAAAGGRGTVTVWDCSQDDRVTAAFPQLLGR